MQAPAHATRDRRAQAVVSARAARTIRRPTCSRARGAGRHRLPLHDRLWMDRIDQHASARWAAKAWHGSALAPFAGDKHVFAEPRRRHLQPLGLAGDPRRRSPPGVNITYKILYNDAVAMTGGQPAGRLQLSVQDIAWQVHASEGAKKIGHRHRPASRRYDGRSSCLAQGIDDPSSRLRLDTHPA
ncbi:hypothetical protein ACTMU2_35235 [Cupriavidus basilensis]